MTEENVAPAVEAPKEEAPKAEAVPKEEAPKAEAAPKEESAPSTEAPKEEQKSESSTAVSYTHLRAHETDSYLVCRLLLEKKIIFFL